MEILGYPNSHNVQFGKEGGRDTFTLPHEVTTYLNPKYDQNDKMIDTGRVIKQENVKGQLHIPNGALSSLTKTFRKYLSVYPWRSIYIKDGDKLKSALICYPRKACMDEKLTKLEGENPFWTKVLGDGRLTQVGHQEVLVLKGKYWIPQYRGHRTNNSRAVRLTRDGYIPIYRVNTLFRKIMNLFYRMCHASFQWMEVTVPSSGEKFLISPTDYKAACKILKEKLTYHKCYQKEIDDHKKGWWYGDSSDVAWI